MNVIPRGVDNQVRTPQAYVKSPLYPGGAQGTVGLAKGKGGSRDGVGRVRARHREVCHRHLGGANPVGTEMAGGQDP